MVIRRAKIGAWWEHRQIVNLNITGAQMNKLQWQVISLLVSVGALRAVCVSATEVDQYKQWLLDGASCPNVQAKAMVLSTGQGIDQTLFAVSESEQNQPVTSPTKSGEVATGKVVGKVNALPKLKLAEAIGKAQETEICLAK